MPTSAPTAIPPMWLPDAHPAKGETEHVLSKVEAQGTHVVGFFQSKSILGLLASPPGSSSDAANSASIPLIQTAEG